MPVSAAAKVEALSVDLGSQRRLADALGVSPAQVSRWTRGQGIDPENAERLDGVPATTVCPPGAGADGGADARRNEPGGDGGCSASAAKASPSFWLACTSRKRRSGGSLAPTRCSATAGPST